MNASESHLHDLSELPFFTPLVSSRSAQADLLVVLPPSVSLSLSLSPLLLGFQTCVFLNEDLSCKLVSCGLYSICTNVGNCKILLIPSLNFSVVSRSFVLFQILTISSEYRIETTAPHTSLAGIPVN